MQSRIITEGLDRRMSSGSNQHLNDNNWGPCCMMKHACKWQWCVAILCRCFPTGRNSSDAPGFIRMVNFSTELEYRCIIAPVNWKIYFYCLTMLVKYKGNVLSWMCRLDKLNLYIRRIKPQLWGWWTTLANSHYVENGENLVSHFRIGPRISLSESKGDQFTKRSSNS